MVTPCGEVQNMNDWQSTWLGRRSLPRDLSGFEIEAFFTFSGNERRVIEERRGPALKIALALQIGFLRMTGRLLEAVRMVPPALWQHLGQQFDVTAPDLASLRAMYRRRRTLFEHQELACETLGFHWLAEPQRRALMRVLCEALARTRDRARLLQFARGWLYEHRLIVPRERELRTMIAKAIRAHEGQLGPYDRRGGRSGVAGRVADDPHADRRKRCDGAELAVGGAGEAFLPTDRGGPRAGRAVEAAGGRAAPEGSL